MGVHLPLSVFVEEILRLSVWAYSHKKAIFQVSTPLESKPVLCRTTHAPEVVDTLGIVNFLESTQETLAAAACIS